MLRLLAPYRGRQSDFGGSSRVVSVHQAGRGSLVAALAACGLCLLAVGLLEAGLVSTVAKGGWVLLTLLTAAIDLGTGVALYLAGAAIYATRLYAGWGSFAERPDNFAIAGLAVVACLCMLFRNVRPRRAGVAILPAALVVYGLGTTAAQVGIDRPTFAWLMRMLGLPLLLFVLLKARVRGAPGLGAPLGVITALTIYMGAVSILEALGAYWLIRPAWIGDPAVNQTFESGRSGGILMQSEFNGLALTLGGLLSLGLGWAGGGPRRLLTTLAAMVAAAGLFLSYSRGPWLGALLAGLALLAAAPRADWGKPVTLVKVALPVALIALLIVFPSRMARERTGDTGTVSYRLNLWAAALRMVPERPLLGYGFAQFERNVGGFHEATGSVDYQPLGGKGNIAHNTYLSTLVELGAIGLVLYVATVSVVISQGIGGARLWLGRRGVALALALSLAYFVNGLFVNLQEPFTNCLYFSAMGLFAAAGSADFAPA